LTSAVKFRRPRVKLLNYLMCKKLPDFLRQNEGMAGVGHLAGVLQDLQELRGQDDHLRVEELVKHGHVVAQGQLDENGALLPVLAEVMFAIFSGDFGQTVVHFAPGEVALCEPEGGVPVSVRL